MVLVDPGDSPITREMVHGWLQDYTGTPEDLEAYMSDKLGEHASTVVYVDGKASTTLEMIMGDLPSYV